EAHQLGQHQRARHEGNLLGARGQHLGVVGRHGGGGHDDVGTLDVLGHVADAGGDAQALEPLQHRAVDEVGARAVIAEVLQHFGNAAHARAADADEMDVVDGVLHAASSSHARTTASVASIFCIFFACSARSKSVERCI